MKSKIRTALMFLALLVGLSLLLYPSFADYWNKYMTSRAIAVYREQLENIDDDTLEEYWQQAYAYNEALSQRTNPYLLPEDLEDDYWSALNIDGKNIMGYIDIPAADVYLPIYHGTADTVLQIAVGHCDWSYLPVGGEGTHCVLSGHRGLPSAKLFTDIDRLQVGDVFTINVLNETLTYEVDLISVVLPHEADSMLAIPGEDHVTLVTCTPYGVNSHRLLVRAKRIENIEEEKVIRVTSEAIQVEPLIVAPLMALPLLLLLIIIIFVQGAADKGKPRIKSKFITEDLDDEI